MGNENFDLESGERNNGRRPYLASMLNVQDIILRRSISLGSSISKNSQQKLPELHEVSIEHLTDTELQLRNSLLFLMVGDQVLKGSLSDSCAWFTEFLEGRYRIQWQPLCRALKGLPDQSAEPQRGEFAVAYKFVVAVAELLKTKRDLALVEIVDHLDNGGFLKPQLDDQRAIPNQIVFAAIGWLTMLFEAQVNPSQDKLQVAKTSTSTLGCRNTLSTRKFSVYTQSFQYIDIPLHSLFTQFGDLIPDLGAISAREPWFNRDQTTESIMPQHVCWHTLHKVAELRIEWVNALCLHLELDSSKRTLKLFRYPSFARMMSCNRRGNLLSQLLNNYAASRNGDVTAPDVPTEEFFQEILLSYRLIFGQDERSWKTFSRFQEQNSIGSSESSWVSDPMLEILCCKSSSLPAARRIYDEIDASEPASSYEPNTEFPFFGRRLLELQCFVKQHQPRTLKALLSDRRDLNSWWTRWANQWLIFFACFTIVLVILQVIFQIWQVLLAQQQNVLAQEQLAQGQ